MYYLVVSRLVAYKRVDLAIEACNRLGAPLIIVGDGPARPQLERLAGSSVRFVGRVTDDVIRRFYAECKALLFPGQEDFGLAPLEAQASGRPVIAYGRGGVLESVEHGVGGLLFDTQTVDALVDAMQQADAMAFEPAAVRRNAERFDVAVFRQQLTQLVSAL